MNKGREYKRKGKDKGYLWGVVMIVLGAASLSDHITYGVDAFPISAVVLGLGIALVARSYIK